MKVSYSWTLAIVVIAIILFSEPSVSRRTGGGRRGSSSRSSSSSRGGGGGLFDGFKNIFKSKPKPAPKTPSGGGSYPKQQYGGNSGGTQSGGTQSGGQTYLGGGGFVNPNKQGGGSNQGSNLGAGGFVNPNSNRNPGYGNNNNYGNKPNYGGSNSGYGTNYGNNYGGNSYGSFGRNNYGGGYYSPSGFKQSNGLFGTGGKKAFGLGAGAGFIGGAVAGVGAMAVYHRYQQFKTMMYYKAMMGGGYGGYGGYGMGYGYSPYGIHGQSILVNAHDCVGGCPMQAFCDVGICRCREGYEARFGSCYQNFNSVYNTKQNEFNERWQPSFDPYKSCTEHKECWKVDMNMVCSTNTTRCACRDDMRWNLDTGECQVFMDVDCSGVKPKVMALDSDNPSAITSAPEETSSASTSTTSNPSTSSDLSSPVTPTPDLLSNDTLDAFPDKNLTDISVNDTLQDSGLTKININDTSAEDIKAAFCKEIGQITQRFDRQVDNRGVVRDNRKEMGEAALGAGAIALIVMLVCCCCGCLCLCVCINKVKEVFGGMFDQKSNNDNYAPAAEVQMENYNEAPPNPTTQIPPYPMDAPPLSGYPPDPLYPNSNGMNNTPYPPGQPAYNPGYNGGNSDNTAPPYPIYPPNGGGQPPPYPI
ncbi:uncharacterized protein LOC131888283 [Tigriopus californicus]|uniref:uncharacterized protein LOC131888283 n=1 Tax=Tigriopus californicus TaxID=6832 RepID=UPI0027D9E379|nr:uncharacterized protein LOC131888283 [Tigriopus californicus]